MITDIKVTKFTLIALDEMFKRVGFNGFDQSFVDQNTDWYSKRTWTEKVEKDYRNWFVDLYKKTFKSTTRTAQNEAGWFLLCWGWKADYGDNL